MNPSPSAPDDQQHLRLLSIFHYVDAGLTALFSCIFLAHVVMGLFMVFSPESMGGKPGDQPPPAIGWMFTCMGAGMFLIGQTMAVCTALAGRFIARRKRYWFIFVMACIQCAFFPFGTVLGVFTIVTLSRESVKSLFADRRVHAPLA
jgi:hypothetical protein